MKSRPISAIIALFLLSSPALAGQIQGQAKVVDGDSIHVTQGERTEKLRLWGIDAPESTQLGGISAKKHLIAIIKDRPVRCFWEGVDKYKRPLGICYPRTKSGKSWSRVSLNRWQAQYGHAAAYLTYSDHFAKPMHIAMKACRGMWNNLPHCYRRAAKK